MRRSDKRSATFISFSIYLLCADKIRWCGNLKEIALQGASLRRAFNFFSE